MDPRGGLAFRDVARPIHKGLAGVVVDTTEVSMVNPDTNSLTYQGYPVQDLARRCRFEEVTYLLWYGELPTPAQLAAQSEAALPAVVALPQRRRQGLLPLAPRDDFGYAETGDQRFRTPLSPWSGRAAGRGRTWSA